MQQDALVPGAEHAWLIKPRPSCPRSGGASAAAKSNPFAKLFAGCPENAFQKVPPGYAPFTAGQRVGAVVRNGVCRAGWGRTDAKRELAEHLRCCAAPLHRSGWVVAGRAGSPPPIPLPIFLTSNRPSVFPPAPPAAGLKLLGVGFFASMLGVGVTNLLMGVRQMLDPTFVPLNPVSAQGAQRVAGSLGGAKQQLSQLTACCVWFAWPAQLKTALSREKHRPPEPLSSQTTLHPPSRPARPCSPRMCSSCLRPTAPTWPPPLTSGAVWGGPRALWACAFSLPCLTSSSMSRDACCHVQPTAVHAALACTPAPIVAVPSQPDGSARSLPLSPALFPAPQVPDCGRPD